MDGRRWHWIHGVEEHTTVLADFFAGYIGVQASSGVMLLVEDPSQLRNFGLSLASPAQGSQDLDFHAIYWNHSTPRNSTHVCDSRTRT